jgi:hypothetical protein
VLIYLEGAGRIFYVDCLALRKEMEKQCGIFLKT